MRYRPGTVGFLIVFLVAIAAGHCAFDSAYRLGVATGRLQHAIEDAQR